MDTGTTVTQIGKYPILGVLGVGGMGVVYRGIDKSVGREVAIKTLTNATEELRQRFLTEARSGILNHPNIITVYDFGEQDGSPYIVMEFVPGDSLENLIRSGRRFSLIEKLDIIYQTCIGLGYAHKKGVIHRDIKPANIMVQPDGNIKIVDFGVARVDTISGQTQTGMVIGTVHYISPERLLGKSADGRSDIWSVGIVFYQLLSGRMPFPGEDFSVLQKVIHEPHEPLSHLLTGYPAGLDQVLDRALAKNPDDRYDTAEDMAEDIQQINDQLKRDHVAESLSSVKEMMAHEQWTSVRPLLLDLQRLNPQNTEVKKMLRDVQEKLSRQQKSDQSRLLLAEAEEAVLAQRYAVALELYDQAAALDRSNQEIAEKIAHIRGLKEKAEKVALLLEQAREARQRGDYEAASSLINPALELDERNTDLRNERARIVQESERASRERQMRQYSESGRSQLAAGQITEAIKNLHSALEIDPTDAQVQQLYQSAMERQEERRRRTIIDQIVAEISEAISAKEFERALTLIQRAQERLPGEPALLRLKTDAENGQREQVAKKLVEQTSLNVYSMLVTQPKEALAIVRTALEQMPGETRLLALKEKAEEQVRKATTVEQKAQYQKRAQTAIDEKQFDLAIQILESAAVECGDNDDFTCLLKYAQESKRKLEVSYAVANATRDAQALIAAGNFEAAIALLQPVATETGDASLQQLLRQTSAALAEQERRVDTVVTRATALSKTDKGQALQLLASQPQEIQLHPKVISLRASLETVSEKQAPIESPRAVKAAAIQQATVVPAPPSATAKSKRGSWLPILIATIIVLVVILGGVGYWMRHSAPAISNGVLELNATPFAEVVAVTGKDGKAVPLPSGDHWTPMQIDGILLGSYTVDFKASDGSVQRQQCEVTQIELVCNIELKPIDDKAIEEIIGGEK